MLRKTQTKLNRTNLIQSDPILISIPISKDSLENRFKFSQPIMPAVQSGIANFGNRIAHIHTNRVQNEEAIMVNENGRPTVLYGRMG